MFKKTHESGLAITILGASLLVSACGGGGGGGSDSTSSSSLGGDVTGLKAGLYETEITRTKLDSATQTAVSYLSPTGALTTVFLKGAGLSFGTLEFDGSDISGTSSDYRQLDPDERDPEGFVEKKDDEQGTISGTVESRESGRFTTADAEGEIDTKVKLKRQNTISDIGVSLEELAGTYTTEDSGVALTVEADGTVNAEYYKKTTGCHLQGIQTLSVPDTSINMFEIAYTMSECNDEYKHRNGDYTGRGFLGPAENQQMVFAAQNGTVAMQFDGTR
ncbi:hypothetical protein [Marinobacter sp. HL-58]|uniref:hypothetical protein n=1 Tax=Marinobacter sp. HL-58 TaxID=1479237 RepID=UPI000483CE4A|nr:hypothetical protein [Marinobacter sp. HL-58]KPP97658.1 MAG: hypothetical protein HLUCCO03_10805 [Marinobacter sp. HL-58]